MKFLKVGRVAIITRGRYAGRKVRLPTRSRSFPLGAPCLKSVGICSHKGLLVLR